MIIAEVQLLTGELWAQVCVVGAGPTTSATLHKSKQQKIPQLSTNYVSNDRWYIHRCSMIFRFKIWFSFLFCGTTAIATPRSVIVEEISVEASLPSVSGSALCARYALCMDQDHGVPMDTSKEQFLVSSHPLFGPIIWPNVYSQETNVWLESRWLENL